MVCVVCVVRRVTCGKRERTITAQSCRGLLYDLSLSLSAVTSYLLLILSVTGVTVNAFLEARAADLPNAAGALISDGPAFGRKT